MAFHPSLTGAGEWPYVVDVMASDTSFLYVNVRHRSCPTCQTSARRRNAVAGVSEQAKSCRLKNNILILRKNPPYHCGGLFYQSNMRSALKITKLALPLALLGALLLLVAGPGTRFGAWQYGTGLLLMRGAFFVGLAAAAFALILLIVPKTRQGRAAPLAVALVIGLSTAWVPWNGYQTVMSLPFIHDISTDTENPPHFVDVVPLRAQASNPVEYGGDEVAKQQREAYADIRTLDFSQSADATFRQALKVAEEMGWDIVAAKPDEGRIEATATTLWFGFKDDVVIRIEPLPSGSRLDIRSKSRVGRSDVGANAARIRAFTEAM